MIQIVNETKHMMRLILHTDEEANTLCISLQSSNDKCSCSLCKVGKELQNDVKENFQRMTKNKDYLEIPPFRTTKFVPVSKPGHILMYPRIVNFGCELMCLRAGLSDKSIYFHPKGIVITITDKIDADGSSYVESCVCTNDKCAQVYSVKSCLLQTTKENEYVLVQIFEYDVHKWANMRENTFLILPNMERLVFGEVSVKTKEGKEKNINALIRCDANGNPLKRESKKKKRK